MANIFGASEKGGDIFQAGDCALTINGSALYALGAQVSYQRQLSPLMTINKGVCWTAQPPTGTFAADIILTKTPDVFSVLNASDNYCERFSMTMDFGASGKCSQSPASGIKLTATDCYTSGITVSVRGDQGYIGGQTTVSFTKLTK